MSTGVFVIKSGNVVTLHASISVKKGDGWTKRATLPEGFRPAMTIVSKAHLSDQPQAFAQIEPSGALYTSTLGTAGTVYATVSFVSP